MGPAGPQPVASHGERDAPAAVGDDGRRGAFGAAAPWARRHLRPRLRESIGALIDDVRHRGDAAVCDALRTFDGIDLAAGSTPGQRGRAGSRRGQRRGRRGDRRRDRPSRPVQPRPDGARRQLADRERTGLDRRGARSRRSARSACSPRPARPAIRASPTSSPCRPSSPASRRSRSSSRRSPAAPVRSTLPCSWCVASWASTTCSA